MVYSGMMGNLGYNMMSGFWGGSVIWTAILLGLVLLIWLAVMKLWKDVFGKHK